jgi:penicillin-binding protein 1B
VAPTRTDAPAAQPEAPKRAARAPRRKRSWKFYALVGTAVPLALFTIFSIYFYVVFSRMIDARMHGEFQRTDPRVFARPFELKRGQALTPRQLVDRLNDLGYANRARAEQPGEFAVGREALVLIPRDGDHKGRTVRLVFAPPSKAAAAKGAEPSGVTRIELPPTKNTVDRVRLDAPLITALVTTAREKRRDVPLQAIPTKMVQAVLAIEDHRFYDHAGIDPIGIAGAIFRNVFGKTPYLASGSTVTQQLVKNTFLTTEKTYKRKITEWFMSIALERRLSKDEILQLYLNDVSLGQRGSFAIHGVAEAARLFFAKDISNVSLSEAATIAGLIQSPSRLSPFNNPDRARDRRNVVLRAMADHGYISGEAADGRAARRGRSRWPSTPGGLLG